MKTKPADGHKLNAPPLILEAIQQYQWQKAHEFHRSVWAIPVISRATVSRYHTDALGLLQGCGYDLRPDPSTHWLYGPVIRALAAEQGDRQWLVQESGEAPATVPDVVCRECGERLARPNAREHGAWSGVCEYCSWANMGKGLIKLFGKDYGSRVAKSICRNNGVRFAELRNKGRLPKGDD